MNAINSVEMAGTRLALLMAKEFPFLIALCARQDQGPVASYVIDKARDFEEASVKMYQHFERVNHYVDFGAGEGHTVIERLAKITEEVFGECVFSIVVRKRDEE